MVARKLIIVFLWVAPLAAAAHAGSLEPLPAELATALQYSPLEDELFREAERGELPCTRLMGAALVAGGVDHEHALAARLAAYRALVDRLLCSTEGMRHAGQAALHAPSVSGVERQAAAVFRFMHQEILTGKYDLQCSRMTQVLDTGNFNCVTATILFNCLAAETGLKACGGESPSHVISLVHAPGGRLEIETTCARWFERTQADGRRVWPLAAAVSDSVWSAAGYRRPVLRRELYAAELVAIVYYNLGVDLAEQRRYAEAVAANYKALRLDSQCQNARGNLLAAVNNWALELAEREQFAQAVDLLRHGRRLAPDHKTFALNYTAIHQRWVERLCERGQQARADAVLERAAGEHPEEAYFPAAREKLRSAPGDRRE